MGDKRMLQHMSETADDTKPTQCHLSRPIKQEAHLHQEGKTSLAGQDLDPQQADLLQVVQDQWRHSNGRFIANVAMQLRKRAVSLCHQELKEYKRSKKLNILTTAKDIEAAGSQPSSTSYLIPALPHNDPAACSSEPSQRPVPCSRHTIVSEQGDQASVAQVRSDPDRKVLVQRLQANPPPPLANGSVSPVSASHENVLRNPPDLVQTDSEHPFNCKQGPSAAQEAAEPMPVSAAMPATNVSSHGYASQPAKPSDHPFRSCTDKQQWSRSPKQQGSVPSWPQDGSQQRAHHWEHTSSQNFAQGKLTCTSSFPFSKQPCAVMW